MSRQPRSCVLLVNPTSGKGRHSGAVGDVVRRLKQGGLDVEVRRGANAVEADAIARAAVSQQIHVLAVMGGDGMVHLALQAIGQSQTTLGIIATGTGNDVARYLDIPRGKPVEAADIIAAGHTREVDLGQAGNTRYATVLATGFDSRVNERANAMRWPRGQARYNLATFAELGVFKPLAYTLELDGVRQQREAMLVAVGNGPSYGGGLRICEGADMGDGLLDVVIIKPLSRTGLLKVFPRLYNGSHTKHPAYEHHRVAKVSIAAAGIVAYADGERVGALPLTVSVLPAALTVHVPVAP